MIKQMAFIAIVSVLLYGFVILVNFLARPSEEEIEATKRKEEQEALELKKKEQEKLAAAQLAAEKERRPLQEAEFIRLCHEQGRAIITPNIWSKGNKKLVYKDTIHDTEIGKRLFRKVTPYTEWLEQDEEGKQYIQLLSDLEEWIKQQNKDLNQQEEVELGE